MKKVILLLLTSISAFAADTTVNWNTNWFRYVSSKMVPISSATVAGLPTASTYPGTTLWCTDVITPYGTGGTVYSDGTNWRLVGSEIIATAALDTYMLNACAAELNISTPITSAMFSADAIGAVGPGLFGRRTSTSGTGATVVGAVAASDYGNLTSVTCGTTTTGSASQSGPIGKALGTGHRMSAYGVYYLSALSTPSDAYRVERSISGSTSVSFSTSGVGFLYDKENSTTGLSGAMTNNWICFANKAGTRTNINSGLTPSISVSAMDRLYVMVSSTNVVWYTNGVQCAVLTDTAYIPTVDLVTDKVVIIKSAGTTSITLNEASPAFHHRHASRTHP